MKLQFVRTMMLCISGALLAGSAFAQQRDPTSPQPTPSPTGRDYGATGRSSDTNQPLRASKLIGANVKTQTGENLGQIEDVVVNPQHGKIDFAVISKEDKLIPVPWKLLSSSQAPSRIGLPSMQQVAFTFQGEKEKFDSAPSFEKSRWTDMNQPGWSQRVYSHYGVEGESGVGGTGSGTSTGPGAGSKGTSTIDPSSPSPSSPSSPSSPKSDRLDKTQKP